jgi:hypothetical protein
MSEPGRTWGKAVTRDTRKRWRRRIAVVAILVAMLGITALLRVLTRGHLGEKFGPAVFHETGPLGPTDPDASLIVTEHGGEGGKVTRCRVVRYDFKSGQIQPPETVWEGPWSQFVASHELIDNRYLVSGCGSVIDLKEKTLIHEGAGRLIEVCGDRVVSGFFNDRDKLERLLSFNLRTRAIEKLTDRETEAITFRATESRLPSEVSPDGTKVVHGYRDQITLYRVGHPPKNLGRFKIGEMPFESGVWLNDEYFLTQDGNGKLLTVNLDGVRVPVVQIPVKEQDSHRWQLQRDADGQIIYSCGSESFSIDAEAKTWKRCERCEWASLGHGFERSGDDQYRFIYRYKGTEIARAPFFTRLGPIEATTNGYIAVWVGGSLGVWSAGTGKWTTLEVRTHQIAGWIQ